MKVAGREVAGALVTPGKGNGDELLDVKEGIGVGSDGVGSASGEGLAVAIGPLAVADGSDAVVEAIMADGLGL